MSEDSGDLKDFLAKALTVCDMGTGGGPGRNGHFLSTISGVLLSKLGLLARNEK